MDAIQSFDDAMATFMRDPRRQITAGALAVTRNGKLVYAKGYRETYPGNPNLPDPPDIRPDSLFRIASLSKPITAVAILKWVQDGGPIGLDEAVWDFIALRQSDPPDLRWKTVTLRQLLQHTGGWNVSVDPNSPNTPALGYDPMFHAAEIHAAMGWPLPILQDQVIRFMQAQPLQSYPGAEFHYSNFGYALLGHLIERNTAVSYEEFVQQQVLQPMGILTPNTRRMQLGASLAAQARKGEVPYLTKDGLTAPSVFPPPNAGTAPLPYGAFTLEAMAAHGGWLASAVDLARFAAAMDDPARCPLNARSLQAMYAPPAYLGSHPPPTYYGCGWNVRPVSAPGAPIVGNYWHSGSLPGTTSFLARRNDALSGIDYVALFNGRNDNDAGTDGLEIDAALNNAAQNWSNEDLFGQFFP